MIFLLVFFLLYLLFVIVAIFCFHIDLFSFFWDAFFRILASIAFLGPSLFAFWSYLFLKLKRIKFSSQDFALSIHLPQLSLGFGDLSIISLQLLETLMLEKFLEISSLVLFLVLYSPFLKSYVDISDFVLDFFFWGGLGKLTANTVTRVAVWTTFFSSIFAEVMTFYWDPYKHDGLFHGLLWHSVHSFEYP